MIKFLIEKEFKQMLRNSFLPRLIIMFPVIIMLLMPWAADFEIKNINLSVVNNDHGTYSTRLIQKAGSSNYFRLTDVSDSYEEAMESIEEGTTDAILEIPPHFERDLIKDGKANVLITVNTVNGTKGALGGSYLSAIMNDFANDIRDEWKQTMPGSQVVPTIGVNPQSRFNPHLNYKVFIIPALMAQLLLMLCGFLPALNIVGEKEVGTIEQINVTPVSKFSFIISKLIPYWIMGLVVLTICLILARLLYGITPIGNVALIYFFAMLFIIVVSGFGLIISNHSATMQQAMFVMFFFMIIFILMSGLFTPISSMPQWAQDFTTINPMKYFIQVMRMIYLKGSSFADMSTQFFALIAFAVILNGWAVLSYRKNS